MLYRNRNFIAKIWFVGVRAPFAATLTDIFNIRLYLWFSTFIKAIFNKVIKIFYCLFSFGFTASGLKGLNPWDWEFRFFPDFPFDNKVFNFDSINVESKLPSEILFIKEDLSEFIIVLLFSFAPSTQTGYIVASS